MLADKKAQFELRKSIYWTVVGIMITIVIIAFALILNNYQSKMTKVPARLQSELISLRFVNNPDCFAYQDKETGRVFSGMIDLSRFTDDILLDCYQTEKEKGYQDFNFRLKLEKQNKEIKTNNYFNVDDDTLYKEVLVKDGENLQKDLLIIYVQEKI